MSALDSALKLLEDDGAKSSVWHPKVIAVKALVDQVQAEAREELELLRKAAFDLAHAHITDYPDDRDALGCSCMGPHEDGCIFRRILRTDPERARKMGLGWAL